MHSLSANAQTVITEGYKNAGIYNKDYIVLTDTVTSDIQHNSEAGETETVVKSSQNVQLIYCVNDSEYTVSSRSVTTGKIPHLQTTIYNTNTKMKAGHIYTYDTNTKTLLEVADIGSVSSGELSEEQKTIVKNLIANWPGFFRLVEKFFERNDDYNEYDKKT